MSAFIVSKTHIDALLTAGLHWKEYGPLSWQVPGVPQDTDFQRGQPWGLTALENARRRHRELNTDTVHAVGQLLVAQNYASVNYRYDEDELEPVYTFEAVLGVPNPVVVLKAINCYEYQARETPDYDNSEAAAFCQALRGAAIHHLPGYDQAPWEITERNIFLNQLVRKTAE